MSRMVVAGTRKLVALPRKHSRLRHYVPLNVARWYLVARARMTEMQKYYLPVHHRTELQNIYHCTFNKTGSVWIKTVLTDPTTFQYCGLSHFQHQLLRMKGRDSREIRDRVYPEPAPLGTVMSPLYVTYSNFTAMPKPERYRAFFVMRDPRELTVSWYFSTLQNHYVRPGTVMADRREKLRALDQADGFRFAIDHLSRIGVYDEIARWKEASLVDASVMVMRFEDLASADGFTHFRRLFDHLDIRMPDEKLRDLVAAYSFRKLTGRKQGEVNEKSHLRAGGAETWRKYFTPDIVEYFDSKASNVIARTGYPSS